MCRLGLLPQEFQVGAFPLHIRAGSRVTSSDVQRHRARPVQCQASWASVPVRASCASQTGLMNASWSPSLPRAGAEAWACRGETGGEGRVGRRRTVSRMSRKFKKKHARYERPHIITPNLRPTGTVLCSHAASLAAHHCMCARAASRKRRAHHSAKTCDVAEANGAERRKFSPDPHRPTRRAGLHAFEPCPHVAQLRLPRFCVRRTMACTRPHHDLAQTPKRAAGAEAAGKQKHAQGAERDRRRKAQRSSRSASAQPRARAKLSPLNHLRAREQNRRTHARTSDTSARIVLGCE